MPVWDFAVTGSVPSDFAEEVNGAASATVVGGKLVLNSGGTSVNDRVALVCKTPIDMGKLTIIAAEVERAGDNVGPFVPMLLSLIDGASQPAAMTQTTFNNNTRARFEDQVSSNPTFDRWQMRIKDFVGEFYHWSAPGGIWTTTFNTDNYSIPDVADDHPYLIVMVIDGTVSPKRMRVLVFGYINAGAGGGNPGRQLFWDASWRNFENINGMVDPIDNSLWLVLGSLITGANNINYQHKFSKLMIGEITAAAHFAYTNYSPASSFPFPYEIHGYVNPFPDQQSLWIPRLRSLTATITRNVPTGTLEHWVKDPFVYDDVANSGYYWIFVNVRIASTGKCHIYTARSTTLLNATWTDWTLISSPSAGEEYHSFPWVTRAPGAGDWYLFYGVEKTSPPPLGEVQYKISSASDPRSGWGSATTAFDPAGSAAFDDDGASQPFLLWLSGTFTGGTWLMYYAGYDGTVWRSHWAKSTTGITGTYTKAPGGPGIDVQAWTSTLTANAFDTRVVSVGSTAGLAAGSIIFYSGNPKRILKVVSVDSGTQFTLSGQVYLTSGTELRSWHYYSFATRSVKKYGTQWVAWGTVFKFSGGEEYTSFYSDSGANANPESATWVPGVQASPLIDFIPIVQPDGLSNENIGFVWGELQPVQGGSSASIVGAATITLTPAAVMDGDLHRAIVGAITLALSANSVLDYQKHASIAGDVSLVFSPAAALDYQQHRTITADVTANFTPAAILDAQQHRSIDGDVTANFTPFAVMAAQSAGGIAGDIALVLTPAGVLDFQRHASIAGDVVAGLTPVAVMDATTAASIQGDIALVLSPAAAMDFQQHPTIAGDVALALSPAAVLAFEQAGFAIGGDATLALVPAALFDYRQHPTISGLTTLTLSPAALMSGPDQGITIVNVRLVDRTQRFGLVDRTAKFGLKKLN